MHTSSVYNLPKLLNGQYMLTSVLRETADSVVYAAAQKDLRREVAVESLRPECMNNPQKVQAFLETARAQARMGGKFVATVLELLYAEDTWHIARERIQGSPVDELLAAGEKGCSATLCELMLALIRNCIKHDILGINTAPFSIQNAHFMGLSFRFDNLARSGARAENATSRDICNAARELLPIVDVASPRADDLLLIFHNILRVSSWQVLTPLDVHEEFVRLQFLLMRSE